MNLCSCESVSGQEVEIFYMNNQQNNIVSESVTVKSNNKENAAQEIVQKMFSVPVNSNYQSVFPKDTAVNSVSVDGNVATVTTTAVLTQAGGAAQTKAGTFNIASANENLTVTASTAGDAVNIDFVWGSFS